MSSSMTSEMFRQNPLTSGTFVNTNPNYDPYSVIQGVPNNILATSTRLKKIHRRKIVLQSLADDTTEKTLSVVTVSASNQDVTKNS